MAVALVTGATRGIGREVARRLVEAGLTVYLGGRDPDRAAAEAAEIGAIGLQLDVTDDASVSAAAQRLQDEQGLDVLVNNAGIAGDQLKPTEQTVEDLAQVFDTNVLGAFRVLRAVTALLDASAVPVVVNVSSAVGSLELNTRPDSRWSLLAYPMSKAALNMLTIQTARAHPAWRVNSATPGLTATDFAPRRGAAPTPEQMRARGITVNTVEQGAEVIVRLALVGPDGPTGTFEGNEGPVPW